MNAIDLINLTKYYKQTKGIENLTLHIKKGAYLGLIGPNGAGKSTTIRLLLGLIQPSTGEIKIFGQSPSISMRTKIGYLPSEIQLYDHMTVSEVLNLSASLYQKDCRSRQQELLHLLKLDANKKIGALSLGNKKKVGIILALQHQPEILILDEPTSGLDPLIQHVFFDLLDKEHEKGTTIILSSHVLNEVKKHCQEVAFISQGELLMYKDVETLSKTKTKKITYSGDLDLSKLNVKEDHHHFLYNGNLNVLLQVLANANIEDLTIQDPDLEELFYEYYTKE